MSYVKSGFYKHFEIYTKLGWKHIHEDVGAYANSDHHMVYVRI